MHHVCHICTNPVCSDYTSEQIEAGGQLDPKAPPIYDQGSHSENSHIAEAELGMIVGFLLWGLMETVHIITTLHPGRV